MERALIVRKPWIDLILDGKKTWEMRSKPTKVRGLIGLIEQGTGLIVGECRINGVHYPLDVFPSGYGQHKHRIDDLSLLEKWKYPWMLSRAVRYESPIPYNHPKGAVTWVRIAH